MKFKVPPPKKTLLKTTNGGGDDPKEKGRKAGQMAAMLLNPLGMNNPALPNLLAQNQPAPPPEEQIFIKDSQGVKTGKYSKKRVEEVYKAAKAVGVDPYQALALALQETSFGTHKNKVTDETRTRRNRSSWGSVGDVGFDENDRVAMDDLINKGYSPDAVGLTYALKKKLKYAQDLGFNDEAMQLQGYNGYGTITKDAFGGADRAYGVPIGDGIDMKKNPLYGKRLLQLKGDLKTNKDIQVLIDSL